MYGLYRQKKHAQAQTRKIKRNKPVNDYAITTPVIDRFILFYYHPRIKGGYYEPEIF